MSNKFEFSRVFKQANTQLRSPESSKERLGKISKLKEIILRDRESIIDRVQTQTKKSRTDALMSEIFSTVEHLAFLEKSAPRFLKDRTVHTPLALMGKKSQVWFEPMGIVLVISPWNYPFFQAIVPITLSYVCGNATIYKPSEHTPLSGLIESLFQEAGIGADWVQVIYGDGRVGAALIEEKPDKIFFTGSTHTGKNIMAQAARHLIPVELELGGKDPMIVFEDVTLTRAVSGAVWGAMTNCGQSCTSVERVFVQQSIYSGFLAECKRQMKLLTLGVDLDGSKDVGDMTVAFQTKIVQDQLAQADNCVISTLGQGDTKLKPTLVEVPAGNRTTPIFVNETFGPVLAVTPFDTEEEAITLANQSEYGLSASVWSRDQNRAERVARALKVGNVSINNVMLTEGNSALPFGGTKQSGIGRYRGEFGFYAFTNIKAVLIDKDSKKQEANWYPFTPAKYVAFTKMMLALFSRGPIALLRFVIAGISLEGLAQKLFKERAKK